METQPEHVLLRARTVFLEDVEEVRLALEEVEERVEQVLDAVVPRRDAEQGVVELRHRSRHPRALRREPPRRGISPSCALGMHGWSQALDGLRIELA